MKYIFTVLLMLCGTSYASDYSKEVAALKKHIVENDYPELFDDNTYRVSIENVLFEDIDDNGDIEAIVHFKPHYRQSPTIVFYKLDKELNVSRFTESLAPGALTKLGDYYLDSHVLGQGVDFSVGEDNSKGVSKDIVSVALKQADFGSLVLYPDFIHADGRKSHGVPTFIDLSYLKPIEPINNCEDFEFHELNQIKSGTINNKKHLAAWVGEEIYFYRISKFNESGYLDKNIWITETPIDFNGFRQSATLSYINKEGAVVNFTELRDIEIQK